MLEWWEVAYGVRHESGVMIERGTFKKDSQEEAYKKADALRGEWPCVTVTHVVKHIEQVFFQD